MRRIKLLEMKIESAFGIAEYVFKPNMEKTEISAGNGEGKSSLGKAWQWVLGDKCEDIYPTVEGKELGLVTSVEIRIAVGDLEYTLKRVSSPVIDESGNKTGNKNAYYCDEIEMTQANYASKVAGIMGVANV